MIYLDNGASTPVHERVKKAVLDILNDNFGNPSSLHQLGLNAEKKIKEARNEVAKCFGAKDKNIIFTSGGSESNNLAIKGSLLNYSNRGKHLIVSSIEHASIYYQAKKLQEEGYDVDFLHVDKNGFIDIEQLKSLIRKDTILVSIMHVNNEIGTVQDLKTIGALIKGQNHNTIFHIDAVASFGKFPMETALWKADLISVSGHKVYAPKGIGALYIRDGIKLRSLIDGGSQESGMRAGTENTIGIAAFGEACKIINEADLNENLKKLSELREYTKDKVLSQIKEALVNGSDLLMDGNYVCSPYIINLGFKGIKAETLLHHLASYKIYVSTTSACSSKDSKQESRILKEIGVSKEYIEGSIRVSFSIENTKEEIDEFIKILKEGIEMLRLFRR